MLSRLFGFKKKDADDAAHAGDTEKYGNWSFIGTDMHSHLVPGVDDGAQTVEDSIQLIEQLRGMGYRSIITTPHIKFDHYPNNPATINAGLHTLQQALHERNIDIPVKAAAEYYIDDHFMQVLENEPLLTITDNQVLVEISFMFEPVRFGEILFKIQTKGYKPILAHPERYAYYHGNIEAYRELKERGCYLQLNTIALTGYYGRSVKLAAEDLLANGLYDYCGTDMHHIRHADALRKVMQSSIMPALQRYPFLNSKLELV